MQRTIALTSFRSQARAVIAFRDQQARDVIEPVLQSRIRKTAAPDRGGRRQFL